MTRRSFLHYLGMSLLAFFTGKFLAGCGGGSQSMINVSLDIYGGTATNVSIPDGSSVDTAISAVYSYQSGRTDNENSVGYPTTIDGKTGRWRFKVNGVEPQGVNSANYKLKEGDKILLIQFASA